MNVEASILARGPVSTIEAAMASFSGGWRVEPDDTEPGYDLTIDLWGAQVDVEAMPTVLQAAGVRCTGIYVMTGA